MTKCQARAVNTDRDESIAVWYESGVGLRRIGVLYQLSHERVRQILIEQGVVLRSTSKRGLAGERKTLRTPIHRSEK